MASYEKIWDTEAESPAAYTASDFFVYFVVKPPRRICRGQAAAMEPVDFQAVEC